MLSIIICVPTLVWDISHAGVQGWRSGKSTHLPPMWPGFDSQIRRHMWFSTLHREDFSGYSGFPSPQKPTFDLICVNWLIVNFYLQCPQLVLQR